MSQHRRTTTRSTLGGLLALTALLVAPAVTEAGTVPTGFQETVAFEDLTEPTAISLSPDGHVFVAEKRGTVKVFDDLEDTTPTTFADLSEDVYNFWDRGLLGMALDPQFPADPYVYVLYTRDALPNGQSPYWGGKSDGDPCPSPPAGPGPTDAGCVATGRLVRLTATSYVKTAEQPLITDWCQQYPSHSVGDIVFGPEGALYVSGGEGANFLGADWGQEGEPLNPCGDPPAGVGGTMTPPSAEGGALRSQDFLTQVDPAGLSGTIARIDPDTGAGLPDNPLAASPDANARRIVAFGMRNPFRFAVRPGTNELWIGDVGMSDWEEIDRLPSPADSPADNFGWPCYEGSDEGTSARQGLYDSADLSLCENIYSQGQSAIHAPYFAYNHEDKVVPGESCTSGSSSIAGLDFYASGPFPNAYNGALFFADYSRNCIWAMLPGEDGIPGPANLQTFDTGINGPVDLEVGPDGALFAVGLNDGNVYRISYSAGNHSPVAVAKANPTSGPAPLPVELNATDSTDQDGDELSYAWDLDEDDEFDDSTEATLVHEYADPGTYLAKVRVTDPDGAATTAQVEIQAGNTPPTATIMAPTVDFDWAVGEDVPLEAGATDFQEPALPDSAFDWSIVINHCPSNCHPHTVETIEGAKTTSFVGPAHEYPSSITIELTVTDAGGLADSESVTIDPRTVQIALRTEPSGLGLTFNTESGPTPFNVTTIEGSHSTVIAPPVQSTGDGVFEFVAWSDGGEAAHAFDADADLTLTATYALPEPEPTPPPRIDDFFDPADTRPPETRIVRGPRRGAHARHASFRFASDEAGSTFRCKLDRGPWATCSSPRPLRGLEPGPHRFAVRAVDQAGNADPTPAWRGFHVLKRATGIAGQSIRPARR